MLNKPLKKIISIACRSLSHCLLLFIICCSFFTLDLFASATWIETTAIDFGDGYCTNTSTIESVDNVVISTRTDWYNYEWKYRRQIKIYYVGNSLYNYQVNIPTGTEAGKIDLAALSGKIRSDYADIRFTMEDGKTLLNYWAYPSTNNLTGFWVKLNSINNVDELHSIYMYYGNTSATSVSSFDNTMEKISTTTAFGTENANISAIWHFDESIGPEIIDETNARDREFDVWTNTYTLTYWTSSNTVSGMSEIWQCGIGQDDTTKYSGNYSVKLQAINDNRTTFYCYQTINNLTIGKNYQINFNIKYSSRTMGYIIVGLWEGTTRKAYELITSSVGYSAEFYFMSFRATATATSAQLRFCMIGETYGYAYFDLVSIKESLIFFRDSSNNKCDGYFGAGTSNGASYTGEDVGKYNGISTTTVKFATGNSVRFDALAFYNYRGEYVT